MPDPILMAKAFAVAGALGLVVAVLFTLFSRPRLAAAGGVLAAVGAVAAGVSILGLLPNYPPREDMDRLLILVLPAAALAELIAVASSRAGWIARAIVSALAAPVLLYGSVYVTDHSGPGSRTWTPNDTWIIYAVLAVLLMAAWTAMNLLARRPGGGTAVGTVAGTALGAGVAVMLSGYATGGQLGLPLGGAIAGVAIASLLRKGKPAGVAVVGVGVAGLFALLVVGRLFAELTNLNAALLFAAPLLAWVPEVIPERPILRAALRPLLAVGLVATALMLAHKKFEADSTAPGAAPGDTSAEDYMNFGK